jgi:hypothetical protein
VVCVFEIYTLSILLCLHAKGGGCYNHQTLYARVLRAKYFPHGDLLSAVPQAGMSYVWRSILKGLGVLKEGIIWRVGDGKSIRIWDDPWLPTRFICRPATYDEDSPVTFVSELINEDTCTWKTELANYTVYSS